MSRRSNTASRCDRCRLHLSLCICAMIPRLETRTRLVLVVHRSEYIKTTNTGRLAAACLVNSEVLVRGHEDAPTEPIHMLPAGAPSVYRLRSDSRPVGLATLEAIARAMDILEGRQVQEGLERPFRRWLSARSGRAAPCRRRRSKGVFRPVPSGTIR